MSNHYFGSETFQRVVDLAKWSFDMPMSQAVKKLQLGKIAELILIIFAVLFADTTIILFACCAVGIAFVIGLLYIIAMWIPGAYRAIIAYFSRT